MAIPTHLASFVEPAETSETSSNLTLRLKCPCGGNTFEILYQKGGDKNEKGEPTPGPVEAEYRGEFFFVIRARCANCREERLVFDARVHGYDALIGGWPGNQDMERPPLRVWSCRRCGDSVHQVFVALILSSPLALVVVFYLLLKRRKRPAS